MPKWVYVRTDEIKQKIKESREKNPISEDTRQKLIDSHTWKKASDETRKRMSVANKWRKITWWDKISVAKKWVLNAMWKWWIAWYSNVHAWINKVKWSPSFCEHCLRTDKKKYEWANIDHKYLYNEDDYIRLCTQCHRKYDYEYNK